jgi:hypothetical protein
LILTVINPDLTNTTIDLQETGTTRPAFDREQFTSATKTSNSTFESIPIDSSPEQQLEFQKDCFDAGNSYQTTFGAGPRCYLTGDPNSPAIRFRVCENGSSGCDPKQVEDSKASACPDGTFSIDPDDSDFGICINK